MKIKLLSKSHLPQILLVIGISLFISFMVMGYYRIINDKIAIVLFLVASIISLIGAGLMDKASR
jgi:uncharacterized membrane protein YtjA (UPF0391 family)